MPPPPIPWQSLSGLIPVPPPPTADSLLAAIVAGRRERTRLAVPDGGLVAGPLVGWRSWDVSATGFLKALTSEFQWPVGRPAVATCLNSPFPPGTHCVCGLYATKHRCELHDGSCLGLVALWGRVIEHAQGYRAQYAYPVALARPPAWTLPRGFPGRSALDEVAERYGVPVIE